MPATPPRRLLRWATLALLASAILAFAAFAAVPALYGEDVGAGFASVERKLCALDRDGSARLLIAGDSRAKVNLDPRVLDSISGLRAVNIAEVVNFGGDLPTLANVLRKYPRVLEGKPVLLISVSVSGHDDADLSGITASGVLNWSPRDHARVALRKPRAYAHFLTAWYLPFLKRHLVHAWKKDGFACTEEVTLPTALLESRGFRPETRVADPTRPDPGRKATVTREDFILDGGRARAFEAALAWLAASPARAIVLYNAPLLPGWGERPGEEIDLALEAEFAGRVSAAAQPHAKVRFLDFTAHPPPELRPEHFADNYHLNEKGAALFSRRLGEYLVASKLGAHLAHQ